MGKYIYRVEMTPEEDGGYSVEVPDLPGCFTYGDTYEEAAFMAADAAKTYVASLLKHGDPVPPCTEPDGGALLVFFEVDESYIVEGEVVSAAEASRRLGVSAGRVTHMLDSGVLKGYRRGRRTYITLDSVNARLADTPRAGRPRKSTARA